MDEPEFSRQAGPSDVQDQLGMAVASNTLGEMEPTHSKGTTRQWRGGGRKVSSRSTVPAEIRPGIRRIRCILPKEGDRNGGSGVVIRRLEEVVADLPRLFRLSDERRERAEVLNSLQSRTSGPGDDVASRVVADSGAPGRPIGPAEKLDVGQSGVSHVIGRGRTDEPLVKRRRYCGRRSEPSMNGTAHIDQRVVPGTQRCRILAPKPTEAVVLAPLREPERTATRVLPKRQGRGSYRRRKGQPLQKRVQMEGRRQIREDRPEEDLTSVLLWLEQHFHEKERLSNSQEWCAPIPHERKILTVQEFYKAFHDKSTLPIWTCTICYRKLTKDELKEVGWQEWMSSSVTKRDGSPLSCQACFPPGCLISGCADCINHLRRSSLSPAAHLHCRLGCEHMFPDELKGLTPVEEKLIALSSCYGFITSYSVSNGRGQDARYPRHVKGHIKVFPNNVQELVVKVLPHPLLRVMDEIHVSWQGREKPAPSDLSGLLSVRRRVVERALVWLKKNNPHYADIEIDVAEMDSWGTSLHGVPVGVYRCMERNEPSAWEKTRTAHVVPPTERGMDDEESLEIGEVLAALNQGEDVAGSRCQQPIGGEIDDGDGGKEAERQHFADPVQEVTSSGMFALDGPPDVADAEKLRFVREAVGKGAFGDQTRPGAWVGSADGRRGKAVEPYVQICRGRGGSSKEPLVVSKHEPPDLGCHRVAAAWGALCDAPYFCIFGV